MQTLGIQKAWPSDFNKEDFEEGIVGSGEKMQQVLKKVGQVAASEATVMVTGESGTGKELVAGAYIVTAIATMARSMPLIVEQYQKT